MIKKSDRQASRKVPWPHTGARSTDSEAGTGQGLAIQFNFDPPITQEPSGSERSKRKEKQILAPQFQPGPAAIALWRGGEFFSEDFLDPAPGVDPAIVEAVVSSSHTLNFDRGVNLLSKGELIPTNPLKPTGRSGAKNQKTLPGGGTGP